MNIFVHLNKSLYTCRFRLNISRSLLTEPKKIRSFCSFRINRIESPIQLFDGDCGESLTLYDASWPDDSRIIKTFCDTFSRAMEKHDFVSTGNALFVRFESKTGSYSG